ncbi:MULTISPECIES: RIP metalloprotease RseP [Sphingobacterium]|jgi:regulator of sigma E protease|uniref:Zinc metalloprotease n=3 Tax=Sphingobacterium multivorum TaxID=28454 RepID=A0A654DPW7_SPHMU|nr:MULTISPECIES: RIP metalloprotease RseP [Sphingobacterium]HAE67246.1 RIP metalloprotease RseP [Sphingobacterium sp.]MDF2851154.1 metalloprotease RseP [Sphingobacterium multivorum]OFV15310.1 RIP metalloprotease RseP [Sphingobacterium sp. HMSC13C05]QQT46460.1 RIP metalloprotease RseP [Sphingobacterium multivorum]SUI96813.1 Regulator of sigma E protease [Sphingobacterium multivorum]
MGVLIMVGQVILGLSILIVLHELGHFLAARAFGIKVEKFYLFFDAWGVKLFKFNYKGCEYGIGWLPLGGYVKIAGMIDESMDTEQLKGEPQPWEFRSKPAWQRLIVMLGGIIVNIVVGVVVFWMLTFKMGNTDIKMDQLVNGIVPGSIGESIGLKAGDKVIAIDGHRIENYSELISSKVLMGGVALTVERDGATAEVKVPADLLNTLSDKKGEKFIEPRVKTTSVAEVAPGSVASKMGFVKGDSIIAVNETQVPFFDQFKAQIKANSNKTVAIKVLRKGAEVSLQGIVPADAMLGIGINRDYSIKSFTTQYTLMEAFPIGAKKAFTVITDNAKGFGKIFKGEVRADKALSGPIGIATLFGTEVDWIRFWSLVGMLSMALAFMNLLPIPALDGGHVLFLLVEMIQGKPLSEKFLEKAQMVGFFILLALMVFIFGNDIFKLFK